MNVSAAERREYGRREVDYLESLSDNGLVNISVSIIRKSETNINLKKKFIYNMFETNINLDKNIILFTLINLIFKRLVPIII